MGAQLTLPHKIFNLSLSLCFCTWYHAANVITSFCMNHDYIREIEAYYLQKKSEKQIHLKGMGEFLNLKNDDDAEDEEGSARIRDEAIARKGDSAIAEEADVARKGTKVEAAGRTTEV